jgi:hypothetical protein
MSRTRTVGGTITKTSNGITTIEVRGGDFIATAVNENNWNGKGAGMSHHPYVPPHPNDSLSNEKAIKLNIFFDGTQNNKTNTEAGKDHENSNHDDDSYTNDFSNVARGFDATDPTAENQVCVYIEGIGTENLESETTLFGKMPNNSGIPLGEGDRGVKAKVTKACVQAAKDLEKYKGKVATLKVNVYGFSRGSTAARHFLHVANTPAQTNQPMFSDQETAIPPYGLKATTYLKTEKSDVLVQRHGYFGACLAEKKVFPENIVFNFVGLYDTVAAYGMDHRGTKIPGTSINIIDNDTKQLGLDAIKKASFVLQFAANDEHRDNFDLTNIDSAGVRGVEFTLPGVHSDIGGCYVENNEEIVDLYYERYFDHGCKKLRDILMEEGWYDSSQLEIIHSYTTDFTQKVPKEYDENPAGYYGLVGTRDTLHNSYDKIPLNQMFHYSKQFGVKYLISKLSDHQINNSYLIKINNQLVHYMNACTHLRNQYIERLNNGENVKEEYLAAVKKIKYQDYIDYEDLKTLRKEYLHWSSSATKFGLGPREGGVKNATERTRKIQNG